MYPPVNGAAVPDLTVFNPLQSGAAFVCTCPLLSGAAFMCTVGTCYPLGDAVVEVDVSWWVRVVVALAQVLYLIKLYRGTVSCRPL